MKNRFALVFLFSITFLLLSAVSLSLVGAQENTCPSSVTLSLPRANAACSRLGDERGLVCLGNGRITPTYQPGAAEDTFSTAGDTLNLADLQGLQLDSSDAAQISVGTLFLQANLLGSEAGRSVVVLLFGDAEIESLVPVLPTALLTATGSVNVREVPDSDGDIRAQLTLRETITANGRAEEGGWLRVALSDGRIGWVEADSMTADGDVNALDVVAVDSPVLTPFQSFTLRTGTSDALCATAPNSGAIIQTPGDAEENVELFINCVTLRLNGTAFIQSRATDERLPGVMTVNVIDGRAEVVAREVAQVIPAGARARVPLDEDLNVDGTPSLAEPYVEGELQALPVNNLPARLVVPAPLTPDAIADFLVRDSAPSADAPPPSTTRTDTTCRRTTERLVDLTAGPGSFYEVVNNLPEGSRVTPVYQTTDAEGRVWWQLRNGNWIPADRVQEEGACQPVPVLTVVNPPRSNGLALEGCFTDNGPIRDGQRVEIRFIDGGWETREEAFEAPNIDPGSITINGVSAGYVHAGSPFQVNGKYFRYFSVTWSATTGTYRIVGDRLTYTISCNITVPVG
ncbi:MAG: SH3 domain-containing protein [bacterium]|nr:SH3 domain-containing protein [bacterium]